MAKTKRILNCVKSRDKQNDWQIGKAITMGYIPEKPVLPKTVNLHRAWWGISDQGTTGSCVGWASTDSLLRYHFSMAGKIKKGSKLSVRFVWMSAKETDQYVDYPSTFVEDAGSSIKTALDVARKFGVLTAKQFPFNGKMVNIKEKNYLQVVGKLKIKAYFNLARIKSEKLKLFRLWLAYRGPILTTLDCDSSWDKIKADGFLEKYDKKSIDKENPSGHAVAIVGYTETHFIIRNSWGTGWGRKGFAYASYDYVLDAFNEAYGIVL